MSGDSGGDTGTSCLEHNFFSDFEACPRCMVDVANMRIKWLKEELTEAQSEAKGWKANFYNERGASEALTKELARLKSGLCLPEVDLDKPLVMEEGCYLCWWRTHYLVPVGWSILYYNEGWTIGNYQRLTDPEIIRAFGPIRLPGEEE